MTEQERDEQRERAFGMLKKRTKPRTEWQEHKDVAEFMRATYPWIRFYSTYDGFYLGAQYAKAKPLRWVDTSCTLQEADENGNGVPDLFVFHNNGVHSMLVIELKRSDISVTKKDGKLKSNEHFKRQYEWLRYLENQGAQTHFASGAQEAIKIIKQYINVRSKKAQEKVGRLN